MKSVFSALRLLSVLLAWCVSLGSCQYDCLERSPVYHSKYVSPILSRLRQKGYSVKQGYLYWITKMKKHGGSPSSAYGMWAFNVSDSLRPDPNAPMSMLFHPSDAVLFTGCTAPAASYIGWENYVYAKYKVRGNDSLNGTEATGYPNGGSNDNGNGSGNSSANGINGTVKNVESVVFSSMNGAVNQHFLNVSGYDRRWNPIAPFNSIHSIITTGDQVTYKDIHREYARHGIEDTVNNVWIPAQYFRYIPYNFTQSNYTAWDYPGEHIDSFMPVQRIIDHWDQEAFEHYTRRKQPCYLVSPRVGGKLFDEAADNVSLNSTSPREPFTALFDRNDTSDQRSEGAVYQEDLTTFIADVVTYLTGRFNMTLVNRRSLVNYNMGKHDYGWSCYDNDYNCQGDLRDEQYWGTHNGTNVVRKSLPWEADGTYYLADESFFVLIGMNHAATDFTVFDNVIFYYCVNQYLGLFEPIYTFTNRDYNGSCNEFADKESANGFTTNVTSPEVLSKFFIVQVARPDYCEEQYDFGVPSMCPNHTTVDSRHRFALYTRNLLNPRTLTRPSAKQIIPETLLEFRLDRNESRVPFGSDGE